MKYLLSLFIAGSLLTGCSNAFYEYKSTAQARIYDNPRGPGSAASFALPANESVIVKTSKGSYRQVRYKDYYGWINVDSLQKGKRSNAKSFGNPEDGFVWDTSVSPTGTGTGTAPAKKGPPRNGGGHAYGRGNGRRS